MARIVKLIVSIFYLVYLQIKIILSKVFRINLKPLCVTLYYHSIFENEIPSFEKQMKILSNSTMVISSNNFDKLEPNQRYSIITFDDGFENVKNNAVPILDKLNLPFTIFFISGYFGKTPGWEFPYNHKDAHEKIMTIEQVKQLPQNLLTIGSHTVSHQKLTILGKEEMINELTESKKELGELFGREIETISFPNGEYNNLILDETFKCGYTRAFTIEPAFSNKAPGEKIFPRVWANGNDSLFEFWLKAKGGYCWLNSALILKNKLMSVFYV